MAISSSRTFTTVLLLLSLAFMVASLVYLAPKRCQFNVPGGQQVPIFRKAPAVFLRDNRQQGHREGLHGGVVVVDPHHVDDGEFPLLPEHLAPMRCGIAVQPSPLLDQGLQVEKSLPVEPGRSGLQAPLEKALDVGALGHELKEELAHELVALLHLLIGSIGQLDLGFGRLTQLRFPLGSHQLPVEETIQERHLRDEQAPDQAFALFPGLERQLTRCDPQRQVPPAPDGTGRRDAQGVAHGEDRDIRPAIRQVEGRNLIIEKGQGDRRLPQDRWLMFIHGVRPSRAGKTRFSRFIVQKEQAFHPIVAVSPLHCKHLVS
jgi:hypothetical protein